MCASKACFRPICGDAGGDYDLSPKRGGHASYRAVPVVRCDQDCAMTQFLVCFDNSHYKIR
jgi:hypothetical protein